MMMGVVGIGGALGLGLSRAETGPSPQLDMACIHPAFAAPAPTVIVNGGKPTSMPLVGQRAHNDYCSGPDVILPADWGSA